MNKPNQVTREQFHYFLAMQTRWADCDMYGHVNNVTYYSYFDTATNRFLIEHLGFNPATAQEIGLVVDSQCSFLAELNYPEAIDVAVAIEKIGNSSLQYRLAIFKQGQTAAAAQGRMVHVFVHRDSRKPTALSEQTRALLQPFLLEAHVSATTNA